MASRLANFLPVFPKFECTDTDTKPFFVSKFENITMHYSAAAVLCIVQLTAATATTTLAACNRDNCLRAVVASSFPTRSGAADCSSFFKDTVTPATVHV